MKSPKSKGANAEREAARLLSEWLTPVSASLGIPVPEFSRNLEQVRGGGYDLIGLDWLALEVKRQENLCLPAWWRQTIRQAVDGQVPFLMYRQNRRPWKFRLQAPVAHYSPCGESGVTELVLDLEADQAKLWLQKEFWLRMKNSC